MNDNMYWARHQEVWNTLDSGRSTQESLHCHLENCKSVLSGQKNKEEGGQENLIDKFPLIYTDRFSYVMVYNYNCNTQKKSKLGTLVFAVNIHKDLHFKVSFHPKVSKFCFLLSSFPHLHHWFDLLVLPVTYTSGQHNKFDKLSSHFKKMFLGLPSFLKPFPYTLWL